MGTFSLNIGTPTEATSYPLHIQSNFDNILLSLQDNTSKLINPKDIRNGILSLWSSTPFKETNNYIGLDSNDPNNRDIKNKLFFGKRSFSGTYSYSGIYDIMNSSLLSSDVDIFLYNTKIDTISNTITKLSILSGDNPNLYSISPYIQSEHVSGSDTLSIDFVAFGDVNITNGYNYSTSGTFSINKIPFPSIHESTGSASDATTLFWRGTTSSGKLSWEQITFPITNTIGTSSLQLNIFGTPVTVNNYSLELNDSDYMPISVGGISMGTTFSNLPIVEVLRRIIYTYLGPLCSLTINSKYVELGTTPQPILTYTINKRTNVTQPISLSNMIPGSLNAITDSNFVTQTGTAIGLIPNATIGTTPINFTITVSDGIKMATASSSIQGILPYFYGIVSSSISQLQLFSNLNKVIEPKSDKIFSVVGTGDFYFIYDSSYPDLTHIYDESNDIISSFTQSIVVKSSPAGFWVNKSFKVYKLTLNQPIAANYQFRY